MLGFEDIIIIACILTTSKINKVVFEDAGFLYTIKYKSFKPIDANMCL